MIGGRGGEGDCAPWRRLRKGLLVSGHLDGGASPRRPVRERERDHSKFVLAKSSALAAVALWRFSCKSHGCAKPPKPGRLLLSMGRLGQTFLLFFGRGTGPKRSGAVLACFWNDFQAKPSILDPIWGIFDDLGPNRHFGRHLDLQDYNPPRNLSIVPCTVLNAPQAQISMLDVLC